MTANIEVLTNETQIYFSALKYIDELLYFVNDF